MFKNNTLGFLPRPGFQSPPGRKTFVGSGNPNLNLHLPLASWEGGTSQPMPLKATQGHVRARPFTEFTWRSVSPRSQRKEPMEIQPFLKFPMDGTCLGFGFCFLFVKFLSKDRGSSRRNHDKLDLLICSSMGLIYHYLHQ